MHVTAEALLDLCLRAELGVTPGETAYDVRARHDRWPNQTFLVVADERALSAALHASGDDVEELWPGLDRVDGALALLATSLRAALDVRRSAPEQVAFSHAGMWVVTPADDAPDAVGDTDGVRWSAADPGQAPG